MNLVIYQCFSCSHNTGIAFMLFMFIISHFLSTAICVWSFLLLVGCFLFVSFSFPLNRKVFPANSCHVYPEQECPCLTAPCFWSIYCSNSKKVFMPNANTISFSPDSLRNVSPLFSPTMFSVLTGFPESLYCIFRGIVQTFSSFDFPAKCCANKRLNWRAPGTL